MADRKQLGMTAAELTATLVAMLMLGALAGWGLFGQPRLIDAALKSSGAADWVVAVGTWVIGYGAVRFAGEAHKLRRDEVIERRITEIRLRNAARNDLFSRLLALNSVGTRLEFMGSNSEKFGPQAVQHDLKDCLRMVRRFELVADDKLILTPKLQASILLLQSEADNIESLCGYYMEVLSEGRRYRVELSNGELGIVASLSLSGERIKRFIEEAHSELNNAREDEGAG